MNVAESLVKSVGMRFREISGTGTYIMSQTVSSGCETESETLFIRVAAITQTPGQLNHASLLRLPVWQKQLTAAER